jgi:hypothetical protein
MYGKLHVLKQRQNSTTVLRGANFQNQELTGKRNQKVKSTGGRRRPLIKKLLLLSLVITLVVYILEELGVVPFLLIPHFMYFRLHVIPEMFAMLFFGLSCGTSLTEVSFCSSLAISGTFLYNFLLGELNWTFLFLVIIVMTPYLTSVFIRRRRHG